MINKILVPEDVKAGQENVEKAETGTNNTDYVSGRQKKHKYTTVE